jgi:hypothetical protein
MLKISLMALAGGLLMSSAALAADGDVNQATGHHEEAAKPSSSTAQGGMTAPARAPAGVTHEYHRDMAPPPPPPPPAPDGTQSVVKSKSNITNN